MDTLVPLFKFRIFCPSSTTNSSSKTVTPLVAQSSGSSLSSIPHTGMNNEVATELGMVGAGLVLGLIAKRKDKEK